MQQLVSSFKKQELNRRRPYEISGDRLRPIPCADDQKAMINNYRVSPAESENIGRPLPSCLKSTELGRRRRKCFIVAAVVSSLVIAGLIAGAVILWLAMTGSLFKQSSIAHINVTTSQNESTFELDDMMMAMSTQSHQNHEFTVDMITTWTTYPSYTAERRTFTPCPVSGQFQCLSNGQCLIGSKRCNRYKDCPDGSDEFNCTCMDTLRSEYTNRVCDGYPDCPLADDEQCPYQCDPVNGDQQFRCSINGECLRMALVCNGVDDCQDGEDEAACWMFAPNVDATLTSYYQSYYDFGYVYQRRNGFWYPVCLGNDVVSENDPKVASLATYVCQSARFENVIYYGLRRLSDTRVPGYSIAKAAEDNHSGFGFSSSGSCPGRLVLYVACGGMECGNLPDCRGPTKRIVGGTSTEPFCNPWAVALYRDGEMVCQAIVLNNLWLLTAAHCFKQAYQRRWVARLGMYRQSSWNPHVVVRRIVGVLAHPNFTDTSVETNDIALIRLDRPVTFGDSIQPPCLPEPQDNEPADGDKCTAYGWGYTVEQGGQTADELLQVELSVMSNARCNVSQTNIFRTHITDGHLCLDHGTEMRDACQGDSGGPLLCNGFGGRRYLAGITSTGNGCARPNVPGVWTRLSRYMDWVRDTLTSDPKPTPVNAGRCSGFQCSNGDCVDLAARCDGGWDCALDGADELHCPNRTSSTAGARSCNVSGEIGYFCTDNLTCLPYHQRCDFVLDCPDGDDEANCYNCQENDIVCDQIRRCIPFTRVIDQVSNHTFSSWLRDRFDCR